MTNQSPGPRTRPGTQIREIAERLLVAVDGCIVHAVCDVTIGVDRHVNGLMDLKVIIGFLPDEPEVIDEREFGCSARERDRVYLLRQAHGIV